MKQRLFLVRLAFVTLVLVIATVNAALVPGDRWALLLLAALVAVRWAVLGLAERVLRLHELRTPSGRPAARAWTAAVPAQHGGHLT